MRSTFGVVIAVAALAACSSNPAANNQAEAAPEANDAAAAAAETDVAAAQRLVRQRVGQGGEIRFGQPQTGTREGVSVVCGRYSQAGREHRYIVVNRDDVFVEPEMRPGEMPRAVAEFCGDGERG